MPRHRASPASRARRPGSRRAPPTSAGEARRRIAEHAVADRASGSRPPPTSLTTPAHSAPSGIPAPGYIPSVSSTSRKFSPAARNLALSRRRPANGARAKGRRAAPSSVPGWSTEPAAEAARRRRVPRRLGVAAAASSGCAGAHGDAARGRRGREQLRQQTRTPGRRRGGVEVDAAEQPAGLLGRRRLRPAPRGRRRGDRRPCTASASPGSGCAPLVTKVSGTGSDNPASA